MKRIKPKLNTKNKFLITAGIGAATTLFLIVLWRFALFNPESVHVHANFEVHINDKKEEFDSFVYYEETEACTADNHSNPKSRTHMHEPNNDLIHVHDDGVTWAHFWESLGWTIGDNFIETRTDNYATDDKNKLTIVLNGKQVNSLNSKLIEDDDNLLVYYGSDSSKIEDIYNNIANTAGEYNEINDPASCSGATDTGFKARLKHSVGL